jgi:hypothetical protein
MTWQHSPVRTAKAARTAWGSSGNFTNRRRRRRTNSLRQSAYDGLSNHRSRSTLIVLLPPCHTTHFFAV